MAVALTVLTILAALGCGLIAGVFFAFSTFVMKALGQLPPVQGILAMQRINVVVINPWFMAAFLGSAALCVALAVVAVLQWSGAGSGWLLVGCGAYLVGTFGVTMVCNVPRNNALAGVDPASAAGAEFWTKYLREWTMWNQVRTAAAMLAMVAMILGLVP